MPEQLRFFVTCRTCSESFLSSLSHLGEVIPSPFRASRSLSEQELIEGILDKDIVIAGVDPFTQRVIEAGASSRLKMIARFGIGLDNVDLRAATEKRIPITYAPRASTDSVAEFAVALILSLLRRLPEAGSAVRSGAWPMSTMRGRELNQKTVGIVGFGAIGRRVGEILGVMGARVVAFDPYVKDDDTRLVSLEQLLGRSDIVTIHSSLTLGTRHLFGERELSLMKKTALLINTARGAIVDEIALRQAIERGVIGGAALDVLEVEPPGEVHPLARFPNVLITPHIAGNTEEATDRIGETLIADIERVVAGKPPVFIANPEVISSIDLNRRR